MMLLFLLIVLVLIALILSLITNIPIIFGGFAYLFILTVLLSTIIFSIIRLFVEKKKKNYKLIIYIIISLVLLINIQANSSKLFKTLSDSTYLFSWRYYTDKKDLKKIFNNDYKIVGLYGRDVKVDDYGTCSIVYNVKLKDNTNIIFQAHNCYNTWYNDNAIVHNYTYYYLPYYYDIYKKDHSVSFRIQKGETIFDIMTIIYNDSNKEQVSEFLRYFKGKTGDIHYQIKLYNEDKNYINIFGSWNNDYNVY